MIENLGNLGDFIGGFGVVVTVIYLAYQIRQNTKSTKTASHQAVVADISRWTLQIGLSEKATNLYRRGLEDMLSMSDDDQLQFSFLIGSVTRHYENIHYQHRSGAIDDSIWAGWSSRILGQFQRRGAQQWWGFQKSAFSREFQAFVDSAAPDAPVTPISTFEEHTADR